MDPPDMSEIAPDPTILDLTEAPPRLGRASDRGRSSPRRHRASDRKEWSDQGRTEPRALVVWLVTGKVVVGQDVAYFDF